LIRYKPAERNGGIAEDKKDGLEGYAVRLPAASRKLEYFADGTPSFHGTASAIPTRLTKSIFRQPFKPSSLLSDM
jgi:hypothetical protein